MDKHSFLGKKTRKQNSNGKMRKFNKIKNKYKFGNKFHHV